MIDRAVPDKHAVPVTYKRQLGVAPGCALSIFSEELASHTKGFTMSDEKQDFDPQSTEGVQPEQVGQDAPQETSSDEGQDTGAAQPVENAPAEASQQSPETD